MSVYGNHTHTINNTIIANRAGTGPDIGINSGTHTFNITNSLILSTAGMTGIGVPTNGVNGNIIGVDPQLAPLANNGGPTQTHALLATSPAINGGNNAFATATDQRGFVRILSSTVDIGAYESVFTPVTIPATIPPVAAPGLDLATIRRIWSDPIEDTDELIKSSILERACASIPNLELEEDEGDTVTEDDPLDAAAAQAELDENCLPLSE